MLKKENGLTALNYDPRFCHNVINIIQKERTAFIIIEAKDIIITINVQFRKNK